MQRRFRRVGLPRVLSESVSLYSELPCESVCAWVLRVWLAVDPGIRP